MTFTAAVPARKAQRHPPSGQPDDRKPARAISRRDQRRSPGVRRHRNVAARGLPSCVAKPSRPLTRRCRDAFMRAVSSLPDITALCRTETALEFRRGPHPGRTSVGTEIVPSGTQIRASGRGIRPGRSAARFCLLAAIARRTQRRQAAGRRIRPALPRRPVPRIRTKSPRASISTLPAACRGQALDKSFARFPPAIEQQLPVAFGNQEVRTEPLPCGVQQRGVEGKAPPSVHRW